jgi:hypothetical protein
MSEWSVRYVSRCGIMSVARRYGFANGLSDIWFARGWDVKDCIVLAKR